jgi:hypothetical protein
MAPRPMPVAPSKRFATGEVFVMVRRNAILGLLALVAVGCNAGPSGGLKRTEPPVTKETITTARIINQHNKNAATIQSLMATPSIIFAAEDAKGRAKSYKVNGRMAMERERDFRLEISSTLNKQADIGSNAKEFWFWVNDNPDNAIYVCDHDQVNASPMAVTMQPDWIMEAMGLREISEREARTINTSKGDKPGQLVLTQLREDAKGGSLTKVTVVNEATGEILEHRLYAGAKERLLARATIAQSQQIEMGPTKENPKGSVITFPAKLQLEWLVEKFSIEITMRDLVINPEFPKAKRAYLFSEPQDTGANRKDLARMNPETPGAGSSRIYESAPRAGIRLGNPEAEPAGVEGASIAPSPTLQPDATQASLPALPSEYVGPQVPVPPESEAVQAASSPGLGRGTFRQ